jgi:acetate kinase
MLILTVFHKKSSIVYSLYKTYQKKFVLQMRGLIDVSNTNEYTWEIFNSQHQKTHDSSLKIDVAHENKYSKIAEHLFFNDLNPSIIIHKFSKYDAKDNDILRLDTPLLNTLKQQIEEDRLIDKLEIDLADAIFSKFTQAKHYACFSNSFHAKTEIINSINFDSNTQAPPSKGLLFSSILLKLGDFTKQSIKKNKWIIIYVSKEELCVNAIKDNSSKVYYNEYLSSNNVSHNELTDKIIALICQLGTKLNGVNGIIFTGSVGLKSAKLRQIICQNLEWVGIKFSNKLNLENRPKISKKSSNIEVFNILAEPETFMLKQLSERL